MKAEGWAMAGGRGCFNGARGRCLSEQGAWGLKPGLRDSGVAGREGVREGGRREVRAPHRPW